MLKYQFLTLRRHIILGPELLYDIKDILKGILDIYTEGKKFSNLL